MKSESDKCLDQAKKRIEILNEARDAAGFRSSGRFPHSS